MKRGILVLLTAFLAGIIAYWIGYRAQTSAQGALANSAAPEIVWLKSEFRMGDIEFERIARLHAEYKPHCKEMSRRIDQHNKQANELIQSRNQMTPQIESLLLSGAQLRAECQRDMLRHFYAVAAQMPPAQARRYLQWVCGETSVTDPAMKMPR